MFSIEMLPAREGDCLWIRYGKQQSPKQILIDGGRAATYKELKPRLQALPSNQRHFELLVITHIDRDHIEGVLGLLEDKSIPVTFGDIWFNGFDHLQDAKLETFGAVQGERLTAALLRSKAKWNAAFKTKAVAIRQNKLPTFEVAGGLKLTVLSPDKAKLVALIPTWKQECKDAGLIPGTAARRKAIKKGIEHFGAINVETLAGKKFVDDDTKPNGSSIALLAEHDGKRVLLAADAHMERLVPSVKALLKGKKRLPLDALKVSHHGSEGNLSKDLLDLLDCPRYLLSTNGSYFKHPKAVAIARILKFGGQGKTIYFNYDSKFTRIWDKPAWKNTYDYTVVLPPKASNGTLLITL
jgi:beta-lactamase superfamily II metal-dependent hydrolase